MMRGEEPDEFEGRVMDTCLVLHAEHGLNASTFTARVVASTLSTCYSSISAAIGSLYGSLHGGANERAMTMVETIDSRDEAAQWVNNALDSKQKVMGMGHRVYKAKDPRSIIMEEFLVELSKKKNNTRSYDILKEVEKTFRERMEQRRDNRLYRPKSLYVGSEARQWVPLEKR
jgi:citrate synthase